jgi:predicted metal-dependent peptidase
MSNGKTVEQRIERANLNIMKHPSFCAWAGLLFIGEWSVDDKCPTAYVNAKGDVKYGRKFIDSLPRQGNADVHVNFVVLHETGHKALLHLTRGKELFKRHQLVANIAADHVVNNMILESDPSGAFAKMPVDAQGNPIGACDPKYKGWSLKEVFNDIMKNVQTVEVCLEGAEGEGDEDGEGSGKGKGKSKGTKGAGKGNKSLEGQLFDAHDPTRGSGGNDGESGEDGDDDGEGSGNEMTEQEVQDIEDAVERALRDGSYLAGKQGGDAKRLMGDMLEPKIDWKEQLAEFVQEACQGEDEATWRRPMRRFVGEDIYVPSYYQETIGEIVCGIDVSGSIGDTEMTACLSEVVEMCRVVRPSKLRLLYWDDGIQKEELYDPEQYSDIVRLTKPKGGGGTDVGPVAKYVNELKNIQCAIILTDGYISGGWRTWDVPVLWVLTTRNMLADCGKSLYIDV